MCRNLFHTLANFFFFLNFAENGQSTFENSHKTAGPVKKTQKSKYYLRFAYNHITLLNNWTVEILWLITALNFLQPSYSVGWKCRRSLPVAFGEQGAGSAGFTGDCRGKAIKKTSPTLLHFFCFNSLWRSINWTLQFTSTFCGAQNCLHGNKYHTNC